MANYNYDKFEEKYMDAIAFVSKNNDSDIHTSREMLIKMVTEPNEQFRQEAIDNYGGYPETLDVEEFKKDLALVKDHKADEIVIPVVKDKE